MARWRTWIIVAFAAGIWTSARADQLVFKNGDRVTGTIVRKDKTSITIKSDNFGVITAPWEQIESVKADKPLTVVLADGRTVQATLATVDGKVELAAKDASLAVPPTEVALLRNTDEQRAYERLLKPGWLDLWSVAATLGWAGTAGNAKTLTFTTSVNAVRATNTDKSSVYFNAIKASALVNGLTSDTAQAVRGGFGYNHNLSPRLFANVFNDYEYDRFQNLDLRFVVGGGAGYSAVKRERSRLDLLGGAAYNRESFSTPLVRNSAEAYWGDDYTYKLSGATSLFQSFRMFNNLTDTGTFRMNGDIGASTKLLKWLSWNVSLSNRYTSDPAPGRKKNDFLYTTGIGFIFAR